MNFSPRLSSNLAMVARIDSPGVGGTTVVALSGRINLNNQLVRLGRFFANRFAGGGCLLIRKYQSLVYCGKEKAYKSPSS